MKKINQFFFKKSNNSKSIANEDNKNYSVSDVDISNVSNMLNNTVLSNDITTPADNNSSDTHNHTNKRDFNEIKTYCDKPVQPLIDFPKNEQKRAFQNKWYKEFNWLEYDIITDSALCFICKQYPLKDKEKETFKSTGFRDWHNAKKVFEKHKKSDGHEKNQMLHLNRINVEASKKSCAALLNSQHAKEVTANRKYLRHIIQVIHFLSRQGLAFRGNNENKETSKNLGNFSELLEFHCSLLPDFKENLESRVAKYTCPSIQNEIIHAIAKQIVKINLPTNYYAIICDETMDLSRKEMLALCLRQVDDSLNIHEKFFGFFRAKIQTADGIFNLIKDVLENELNLDLQFMVAQSFDGAATMAGIKSGVAKRFIEKVPYAVFVHCYAHKLNLALQDATNQLKCVSDVLLIVNNVSVFIERSAKRHALFEHLQNEEKKRTLKNFCATRWSSRYLALKAFVKLYKYLLTFLEIVDDDNDKAIGNTAPGLQKQVKSFNFVFYCNILLLLFEKNTYTF